MKKCVQSINHLILDKHASQNIRLKRACEKAKIKLSSFSKTNIFIEEYLPSLNIDFSVTKEEFEEYCSELFTKFQKIIEDFLKDNNVDKSEISEVIPIGGSILIPKIQEIIRTIFNNSEIKNNLDPKEIVSIGASIQGGILSKLDHLKNYDLLDITNYSLGVELVGERMSKVIKRYTPTPIQKEKKYVNAYDYPKSIDVKVYEGENENIKNNLYLGEFKITNLPRLKKGQIKLKIIFTIDKNSILKVTAVEEQNKKNSKNKVFNLEKNNENNEIQIINPIGLMLIINDLRNTENSMEYIEDILYSDKIKDLILDEENKISELKKNENINKQKIKEKKKIIIEKFRCFINEKLLKLYKPNENAEEDEEADNNAIEQKLILSYIKYYFKIISDYFKNYEEDIEFRQFILDKNNLGDILIEIQYFNPSLLPEIIEEFSDDKQLFQKCIKSLILNLYGKLYQTSLSKEFQKLDKKSLSILKRKIKNTLSLFGKLNPIPIEFLKIKEYLEGLKLKIKAKIFILNKNFFSRFIPKNKIQLNNLIEQYSNSVDYDVNILNELKRLKNLFYSKKTNITKEEMFLKDFQNRKKDDDYLFIVFNEYPVLEDEKKEVYLANDYSTFIGLSKQEKLNFLNDAKMKYEKFLDLIKKDEENNNLLQQVYEKIIMLINEIKDQINLKE